MIAMTCRGCGRPTEGSRGICNVIMLTKCQECRDGEDVAALLNPSRREAPGMNGDHDARRTAAFDVGRSANNVNPLVSIGPGPIGSAYQREISA